MKFLLVSFLLSSSALACGPGECEHQAPCLTYGASEFGEIEDCMSPLPQMDPENLTENNFLVFLSDYFPKSQKFGRLADSFYKEGGISNEKLFSDLVNAQALKPETKKALIDMRIEFKDQTWGKEGLQKFNAKLDALPEEAKKSDFSIYLRGAAALYGEDYAGAHSEFKKLNNSSIAALKELSSYLQGRTKLRDGQKNWDGYALPAAQTAPIDPNTTAKPSLDVDKIREARGLLQAYLKEYPAGNYRTSTQGLLRRAAYLLDDKNFYQSLLFTAIDEAAAKSDTQELIHLFAEYQLRNPYLPEAASLHPIVWIPRSYVMQRQHQSIDGEAKSFSLSSELKKLEKDKERFAAYPGLYSFTRANLLFADKKYSEALKELPPRKIADGKEWGPSWGFLRARILMGLKRYKEARETLVAFKAPKKTDDSGGDSVREFLAYTYLWEGKKELVLTGEYAEDGDAKTIEKFARKSVSTEQLFSLLKTGNIKSHSKEIDQTIVIRLLLQKRYSDLNSVLTQLKAPILTPELRTAISTLATKFDPNSSLIVAGSLESSLIDPPSYQSCAAIEKEPEPKWPIDIYREVIDSFPANVKDPIQAKALYTAIHCYSTRSYNFCYDVLGRNENSGSPSPAIRKKWFKLLHSKYKGSEHAKKTPMYW